LNEPNYARLEHKLERLIGQLRHDIHGGFARLEALVQPQRPSPWDGIDSMFDRFESRLTKLFFVYFMAQGVTTVAIVVGMLKMLR